MHTVNQIKVGDRLLEVGGVKTEGQDFAAILDMVRVSLEYSVPIAPLPAPACCARSPHPSVALGARSAFAGARRGRLDGRRRGPARRVDGFFRRFAVSSPTSAPGLAPVMCRDSRLFYAGEVGIFEVTLLRTEVKKTDAYNNDLTELSGYLWKATSKGMMASVSMRKRWFTLKQNLMR